MNYLNLSFHGLRRIPRDIGMFSALRQLNLSNNRIKHFNAML